jgi:hypothetical protein
MIGSLGSGSPVAVVAAGTVAFAVMPFALPAFDFLLLAVISPFDPAARQGAPFDRDD